jgi:hypothetical protein
MQTAGPFGLKPIFHPSGQIRPRALRGGIASGYATSLYLGSPVTISSGAGGILLPATVSGSIVGSFAGVDYTDSTGRRRTTDYWPANTVATDIVAYFHDDPYIKYAVQANGSISQTGLGLQANWSANPGSGNATTLISGDAINSTLITSGNQGLFRIEDLYLDPSNAWGDAFTTVIVSIAKHQYLNPQVAI